jgi:hypothetical protein
MSVMLLFFAGLLICMLTQGCCWCLQLPIDIKQCNFGWREALSYVCWPLLCRTGTSIILVVKNCLYILILVASWNSEYKLRWTWVCTVDSSWSFFNVSSGIFSLSQSSIYIPIAATGLQNLLQSTVQYMWLEVYTITVTDWFNRKWSNHSLCSWCTKLNALRHGTFLLLHFANKKEKKAAIACIYTLWQGSCSLRCNSKHHQGCTGSKNYKPITKMHVYVAIVLLAFPVRELARRWQSRYVVNVLSMWRCFW